MDGRVCGAQNVQPRPVRVKHGHAPADYRGVLHATNIVMEGADELIAGSRMLLDHSGSPAFCAVARLADDEVIVGACAFGNERAARGQARAMASTIPDAVVYIMERALTGGRVRWTVWHGTHDERLHQAFEEAPEAWV